MIMGPLPASAVAAGPTDQPPAAKASVGPWAAAVVRRAAQLIPTPARWDRHSTGECAANATTFSLICALQKAVDDVSTAQPASSDCRFHATANGEEGSCGPLFQEVPIFTLARVPSVTTGSWRRDVKPSQVWAGKMSDAASVVMRAARQSIDATTTKKYSSRLVDYNNDPETTFADLQKLFGTIEERVLSQAAADLDRSAEDVEIEIYGDGAGVVRTEYGWFPVSHFTAVGGSIAFRFDVTHEVPPNAVDREILQRAARIISSNAAWNRADDRTCPATATTWSIYCAVERAQLDLLGAFHHRRPAGELLREIVDARTKGRPYHHRMMDYNNDPTTQLSDVKSLFSEAIARVGQNGSSAKPPTPPPGGSLGG